MRTSMFRALCAWAHGRTWTRVFALVLVSSLVVLTLSTSLFAAPPTDQEGYVVTLDGNDVVVDLGVKRGAQSGDVVELWRPLKLKHPVTGKMVADRFRIGTLRLVQVRDALSLAQPDGALARPVAAGDVVILRGAPVPKAPVVSASTLPMPAGSAPPPSIDHGDRDPEGAALAELFDRLHGSSVEARITAYRAFAKAWPNGRYRNTLEEEALALAKLFEAPAEKSVGAPVAISFDAPSELRAGTSPTIAIEIVGDVSGVVLQLRNADETAFAPIAMRPAGPRYWRVQIPPERVRDLAVAYFIEAVLPNGTAIAVEGNASSPRVAKVVHDPTIAAPRAWVSIASVWTDWADYDRLRGDDWAWQTEGYFGMRFTDVGLRAVRSGFGVYKGKGGSLDELDVAHKAPRAIGLSYGYVEAEWGITPFWGLAGRAVVGLTEEGVTGGAQGFLRIGSDRKTNLLLGAEFLGGVGVRGITQFELNYFPRFPILLRSEVTNQPAGVEPAGMRRVALNAQNVAVDTADVGVRAIAQAGFRLKAAEPFSTIPNATLFVRASYQGRTINHAGPGVGAGVSVEW